MASTDLAADWMAVGRSELRFHLDRKLVERDGSSRAAAKLLSCRAIRDAKVVGERAAAA